MKIKCTDKKELCPAYLTPSKVYDVVSVINEDLVVIIGDHGQRVPIFILESSHTGFEPWEIVE